jgi:hypothetical protein
MKVEVDFPKPVVEKICPVKAVNDGDGLRPEW